MTDQTATIITLSKQDLVDLAEMRRDEAAIGKKIVDLQTALDNTQEAKALKAAREERVKLSENIATIESFIKRSALEDFINTHVKPVLAGVTVKIFKTLKYEKTEAVDWAKKNNMEGFFKFDQPGFEKYAKAVADTMPVPCVTIEEDPRVELASDLSQYLEG